MIGIYKITNPSGKVYIGQSRNITKRKSVYKTMKCEGQQRIYRSLKKYGFKDHKFEVIYEFPIDVSDDIINNYESFCINQYKEAGFDLMNLRPGGHFYGENYEETKKKISISLKAKGVIPPSRKGTKLSEEHRLILISSRKGKKNSDAHNKIITDRCKLTYLVYLNNVLIGSCFGWREVASLTGLKQSRISHHFRNKTLIKGYKIVSA